MKKRHALVPKSAPSHHSAKKPLTKPIEEAAAAPSPHSLIQLQQSRGNQAVQRMLGQKPTPHIQRDPTLADNDGLTDEEVESGVDPVAKQVYDDFWGLLKPLVLAQGKNVTVRRRELIGFIEQKIGLDNIFEKDPDEVNEIKTRLDFMKMVVYSEYDTATSLWEDLKEDVELERQALKESGDHVDLLALEFLDKELKRSGDIVNGVGKGLVEEDLLLLSDMLLNNTHLQRAEKQASQEEAELEAVNDELMDDEGGDSDDDSSMLGTAWDIFGWDSPGDFLADAALTVLTGGVGKVLKTAYKGRKAKKKYDKYQKVRKLAKANKVKKASKIADAFKKLLDLVSQGKDGIGEQMQWVKNNWKTVSRKIGTDLVADAADSSVDGASSQAAARATKEYINSVVEEIVGKKAKDEQRVIRLCFAAVVADKDESARRLYEMYLIMNGRRRLLVNFIHTSLISTGKLEFPLSAKLLTQIGVATGAEMAQDLVMAVPLLDKAGVKDAIESLRKILQQNLNDSLQALL